MIIWHVEYNHYEDHDFYSAWTTKELAEEALRLLLEVLEKGYHGYVFWDKNNYSVVPYEVTE